MKDGDSFAKRLRTAEKRVAAMDLTDGASVVATHGVAEAVDVAREALSAGLRNPETDAHFDALVMLNQVATHLRDKSQVAMTVGTLESRLADTRKWIEKMDAEAGGPLLDRRGVSGLVETAWASLTAGFTTGDIEGQLIALVLITDLSEHLKSTTARNN